MIVESAISCMPITRKANCRKGQIPIITGSANCRESDLQDNQVNCWKGPRSLTEGVYEVFQVLLLVGRRDYFYFLSRASTRLGDQYRLDGASNFGVW